MLFHQTDSEGAPGGLIAPGWRLIGACVRGPAHEAKNQEGQDALAFGVENGCAVAVVCDGAGSARHARAGSTRVSSMVASAFLAAPTTSFEGAEAFRALVVQAVDFARGSLLADGLDLEDCHATLVALVATPERTLLAHVGDGLAAVAPTAAWGDVVLSEPRNGEYANQTWFVTMEDWPDQLRVSEAPPLAQGGVAVAMTDGAMPFVISADGAALEPDFMGPVSRFLYSSDPEAAARALHGTLGSKDARRISGDDKTLIWIGREPAG
ncbi:hypothetical protein FHW79_003163 [Azospirillum sp. OGB3]|nr:PP2C family serine/threonine-protein phosphatase [Azospirillum sp. OGB3]MBB3265534.1 hypothetical protein [Azospirillum sp. OGB3]